MRYSSSTYLYSIIKSIGYSNIITYCSANLSSNSSTYLSNTVVLILVVIVVLTQPQK